MIHLECILITKNQNGVIITIYLAEKQKKFDFSLTIYFQYKHVLYTRDLLITIALISM